MRIAFANDHAAYDQREAVIAALKADGHDVLDFGSKSPDSVDYPDFVAPAAEAVAAGQVDFTVVMCGSGQGASIVANKIPGVRCALVQKEDEAEMTRRHNDANALALSARSVPIETNIAIAKRFIEAPFEGGRHQARIDKIKALEDRCARSGIQRTTR